ncbi:MAG: hypothetical protein Pg6C_15580 [Treponemataceae bacterium]|nr:MAG: hypothetical protein Pg6C_15580 [Treponemataceae bacterium]
MFSISESKKEALSKLSGHWRTPALLTLVIGVINIALNVPAILLYWQEFWNIIYTDGDFSPAAWAESFPFDSAALSIWRLQTIASVFTLAVFVINAALTIALARFYLTLTGGTEKATFNTFFEGLTHWGKSILAMFWRSLWLWLWELLVIVIFMFAAGILLLVFSLSAGGIQTLMQSGERLGTGYAIVFAIIALMLYIAMIIVICNRLYAYSQMMFVQAEYPTVSVSKTLKASIAMTKGCRGKLFFARLEFHRLGISRLAHAGHRYIAALSLCFRDTRRRVPPLKGKGV